MERPSRGGEKRTAVWASHHEERGSEGAVAPPMCDHRVVLHRCVVRAWCRPSGAAVAPGLHAAARTRRAARAVQGDVVSVWQVLQQIPLSLRRNPLPRKRINRTLLMSHQHLARTLVKLMETAKTSSCSNAVLHHAPEAFDGIEVVATMGW